MARPVATRAAVARQVERARNEVFSNNLGRLMRQNGLTMRDLAQRIGISHQAISQWMSGQNAPGNRQLAKLTNVFGVNIDQIISPHLGASDLEAGSTASGDSVNDMLPIRLIDAKVLIDARVANTTAGDDPKKLDANTAGGVFWPPLPRITMEGRISDQSEIVVIRVCDNALEPVLRMDDFVYTDISNPAVVTTPGVYLIMIAGMPAWKHCYALVGEKSWLLIASLNRRCRPVNSKCWEGQFGGCLVHTGGLDHKSKSGFNRSLLLLLSSQFLKLSPRHLRPPGSLWVPPVDLFQRRPKRISPPVSPMNHWSRWSRLWIRDILSMDDPSG